METIFRTLTAARIRKKLLRVIAILLGVLIILVTIFHFWFIHHAESLVQQLVYTKSKGKLRLEIGDFKFNWFSKKMELHDAVFYTTDSATAPTSYRFAVKEIRLKVKAVLPMIFEKRVLINLLSLQEPDIVVTRLRPIEKDSVRRTEDVSIPQEMGNIYNSIQDGLNVLQVKKFEIERAKFTLINKMRPDEKPVHISHFDFHIDNLKVDSTSPGSNEKILFSDNIVFKSRDQDILFPDGRHRLSFRKFRINIEKKIVEFDSCTIAAIKTDSSAAGFSIYFDAMQLTNIDFDTLYRTEVIKADSVFCLNPTFRLDIDLDKRKGKRKGPQLDEIIRQLTGDLHLNFVVVNNASFDIRTNKNGNPSSFTSHNNNFEMQGLRIDNDAARPLRVEKFAMAIRNYENFLRDSSYSMQFDSVLFNDDKIFLSNFDFRQNTGRGTFNSFQVPNFQLTGLNWNDLLFEQKLTAQHATLYDPVIIYRERARRTSSARRRNIFEILADINDVIMLEDLHIINGNIKLNLNGGVQLNLDRANLSVESRSLLGSEQLSGIRRSVNHLDFPKGSLSFNDFHLNVFDIKYTGANSRLNAGKAIFYNNSRTVNTVATGVMMEEILINEITGDVSISGISWNEANIDLKNIGGIGNSDITSSMRFQRIDGNNTTLNASLKNSRVSAFFDRFALDEFYQTPGSKPILTGLNLAGKDLVSHDPSGTIKASNFNFIDEGNSRFGNVRFTRSSSGDSIDVKLPLLSLVPSIKSMIEGKPVVNNITLTQPEIFASVAVIKKSSKAITLGLPSFTTDKLAFVQPKLKILTSSDRGNFIMEWKGDQHKDNAVVLSDVRTEENRLQAAQAYIALKNLVLTSTGGRTFNAENGNINFLLEKLDARKDSAGATQWNGRIATLSASDFILDSLGKSAGILTLKNINLNDLSVSSAMKTVGQIINSNKSFRVQQFTGNFTNANSIFNWGNIDYDKNNRVLKADSFSYRPSISLDSFNRINKYQDDYITARTGKIEIGPFDISSYLEDSVINIGTINIDSAEFIDYRDNRLPFRSGIIKPMLANRITKIPIPLSIDTVSISNLYTEYTEFNPQTNAEGRIPITRMQVLLYPVRNVDLKAADSITLLATGYLLDSIHTRLLVRESYLDSMSGFLMTVRLGETDGRVLNQILVPLASVKIRSGYVDSLLLRANGNSLDAIGELKMSYRDLKIKILKDGNENDRSLKTALLNFIANTFLVKNKNNKRETAAYFLRNQERSSLNYYLKILMSGVSTNVGIKNSRKVIRRNKQEFRERNLPPFEYN